MPAPRNLLGQVFTYLTVIAKADSKILGSKRHPYWLCKCICGRTKTIAGMYLVRGSAKSCGCKINGGWNSDSVRMPIEQRFYNYWKIASNTVSKTYTLTYDEFINIITNDCYYCGIKPSQVFRTKQGTLLYNGIDRVDNNIGYHIDNCVTCCEYCNRMKLTMTKEEFYSRITRIYTMGKINGEIIDTLTYNM